MFAQVPIFDQYKAFASLEFSKLLIEKAQLSVSSRIGFRKYAMMMYALQLRKVSTTFARLLKTSKAFLPVAVKMCQTLSNSQIARTSNDSFGKALGIGNQRSGILRVKIIMNNPIRIGIAGLGTVGTSLVNLIHNKHNLLSERCGRPIEITAVSALNKSKQRDCEVSKAQWIDDPAQLAIRNDIDCFVELIGGEEGPARQAVSAALKAGKHVVTANKALLAKHGMELAELAESSGVLLNFEAAVAGGIPIIKTMRESLTANSVERVYGIMNGTCNYILTRMENEGLSFETCLEDAQRLGYAEADPTFDIEGFDTAHKLAILSSLAFGTKIATDEIYVEGISSITLDDINAAREMGYRIKLLGVAQLTNSGVEQRVHPTMVPIATAIAQISGVTNAVAIDADVVGQLLMSGPGAGGDATASAVAGDIADIAKAKPGHQHGPAFGTPMDGLRPYERARMRAHEGGYFVRLNLSDEAGAFASIAKRMAEQNISLQSIVQHQHDPNAHSSNAQIGDGQDSIIKTASLEKRAQPIILITHETTELAIRKALENIETDGHLAGRPQMIRIEK